MGIEVERQLTKNEALEFENGLKEQGTISSIYKSTMGHSIVHVQCVLPDGNQYDRWTSFSGQNFLEIDRKNILEDKIGLGVLFYDYPDGHIIEGHENRARLAAYKGKNRMNSLRESVKASPRYLQVEISGQECLDLKNMISFFESFHFDPAASLVELLKRPEQGTLYFNASSDPLQAYLDRQKNPDAKVGGGCAPYGVALLKRVGAYDDSLDDSWMLNLKVSERLIGKPGSPVPITDLLFGSLGNSWSYDSFEDRQISLYDPSKIWSFLDESLLCLNRGVCRLDVKAWLETISLAAEPGEPQVFSETYQTVVPRRERGSVVSRRQRVQKRVEKTAHGVVIHQKE